MPLETPESGGRSMEAKPKIDAPVKTVEERRQEKEKANIGVLQSSVEDLESTFRGLNVDGLVQEIEKAPANFPDIEALYDALWSANFDSTGIDRFNKMVEGGSARTLTSLLNSNYRYQNELALLSPSGEVEDAMAWHAGHLNVVRISRHNMGDREDGLLTAYDPEREGRAVYQWTIRKYEPTERTRQVTSEVDTEDDAESSPVEDGSTKTDRLESIDEPEEASELMSDIKASLGIDAAKGGDVEKSDDIIEGSEPNVEEIPEDEL